MKSGSLKPSNPEHSAVAGVSRPFGNRIVSTLGAQTLTFVMLAVLQIALVPFFLRAWGVNVYADWLVIFFSTNLLRALDFGLGFSLGNRLRLSMMQGNIDDYEATIRLGILLYILHFLVAISCLLILVNVIDVSTIISLKAINREVFWECATPLAIGALLSLWRDFLFMIYPAHGELDHGIHLFNFQLGSRIMIVGSLLIFGIGPVGVSLGWVAVDIFTGLLVLFLDLRRRHPWESLLPKSKLFESCINHVSTIGAYSISYVADQILLNAPVLVLSAVSLPQREIVIFNLARTYSNVARQFLTQYSRTFGIELSQLIIKDRSAAASSYISGVRFIGGVSGCLVGGLITAAPVIYRHWIADPALFRWDVVACLTLVFCFTGPAQVPLSLLRHSPRQLPVAAALAAQACLTLMLGPSLASAAGAFGLALVLSGAELFCIVGPAALRVSHMLERSLFSFALNGFAVSIAVGLGVAAIARMIMHMIEPTMIRW